MPFLVVGIDGSASSQDALMAAIEQAQRLNAEVRALSVVSLPVMSGYEYGAVDIEEMRRAGEKTVAEAIDAAGEACGGRLPVTVTPYVETGHVGIEILRAAKKDEGAAMVVAGSRGYGGFKSVLLGSVTTYLAHHLTCPLLIIPGSQDQEDT